MYLSFDTKRAKQKIFVRYIQFRKFKAGILNFLKAREYHKLTNVPTLNWNLFSKWVFFFIIQSFAPLNCNRWRQLKKNTTLQSMCVKNGFAMSAAPTKKPNLEITFSNSSQFCESGYLSFF